MRHAGRGQIIERDTQRGRVFALRFRALGARQYVTLGSDADGWTRAKAEDELAYILAQVRRGVWRPPAAVLPQPILPDDDADFHEFASEWLAARRGELAPKTVQDLEWRLSHHLLPFFKDHALQQITVAEVDRYRDAKVRQGRLGGDSINKTLALLGRILDVAVERELIDRNPLRVNPRNRRARPSRRTVVFLDTAEQIGALLEAAAELDERSTARTAGRRALIATLVLAGLRVGEACSLRWADVDLANRRLLVRDAKTAAGVREVGLLAALRDDLVRHKLDAGEPAATDLVFPTARGGARDKDNVRERVLAPVVRRAAELLAERDQLPLPARVTTHKLRHTFASVLAALGEDPTYIMAQLGHVDPAFTLRVYAHAMRRDAGSKERLRALVEGRHWALLGTGDDPKTVTSSVGAPPRKQKTPQ